MEILLPYIGKGLLIILVVWGIIKLAKHGIMVLRVKHRDTEVEFGHALPTPTKGIDVDEMPAILEKFGLNRLIDQLGDAREKIGQLRNENKQLNDFKNAVLRVIKAKDEHNREAVNVIKGLLSEGDLNPLQEFLIRERGAVLLLDGARGTSENINERNEEIAAVNYVKGFYGNSMKLERLRGLISPSSKELDKVMEIIKDDVELTLYFYDVLDPGWVELLDEAGEFDELREKETGMIGKYKAHYLKQCAEPKAGAVLRIIEKLEAQDINIQGTLVGAIVRMPEETAVKGIELVATYLDKRECKLRYGIGKVAAELMVKLVANHSDKAFEVAEALLDVWVSEEKTYGKDIVAKFSNDEYRKLMLEHFSKVWKAKPEQAVRVLIKKLNRCLEDLDKEGKGEKGYDASISFGYGLELGDLNEIDMKHPRINTVLVKGICEAGRVLIDKEPEKVSDLLDLLEGTKRVIFLRIAMYLLRFVKPETEKERISKFVGNKEYFKEYNPCWNEHRHLLNDKFDDVSEDAKKAFLEWVDEDKYSQDKREEIIQRCKNNNEAEPEFGKWENHAKAEELYLVRERFKYLYEKYKNGSGIKNDSAFAPRKMVGETRWVSPEEGSPYSSEKMGKDNIENVIDYLLEPKNYKGTEKVSGWGTAKSVLAASFKNDVKKRPVEYLNVDLEKLESLDHEFLERLFYGVSEAVRDGSFKKESWERLIDLACGIVKTKSKEKEWKECFLAILWVLHDGFGEESNRITFNEAIIGKFWFILKELVGYNYDEKSESEEDPVQRQLRSVQGGAFERVILLGIECKNKDAMVFENFLKKELVQVFTLVAKEIKRSEVNCTLGYRFASIYRLDKEWVESNAEIIFDDEMWDAVWGTYVSWGRPSPECFKILVEKGKYSQAVELLGSGHEYKYQFGKKPDEGLVEHLMIGYFNGWISFEDEVLQLFIAKAPVELRGYAVRFLTTGFKSVNEESGAEKEKVAKRMKDYWETRLMMLKVSNSANKENSKENEKEAVEFTGWVEDSVLPAKETLELLDQSLEVSGGEIGEYKDGGDFVEWVCKLGKGNELLALQCLKKVAADENIRGPWTETEEPLVKFLEELPVGVRNEGREVADLYGRYNPDKFRGVWEKLNAAKRNEG
jgi:hypothetical protein